MFTSLHVTDVFVYLYVLYILCFCMFSPWFLVNLIVFVIGIVSDSLDKLIHEMRKLGNVSLTHCFVVFIFAFKRSVDFQ